MNSPGVRTGIALFSLLLTATCASTPRPTPAVTLEQLSAVQDVQVQTNAALPVDYRVTIDNPLEHAVTLVSIEVETVGASGGYFMNRVRHAFSRIIQPKTSDTVEFRAWVQPLSRDQQGDVTGPVMLRGTARFQTPDGLVRTNFATHHQPRRK